MRVVNELIGKFPLKADLEVRAQEASNVLRLFEERIVAEHRRELPELGAPLARRVDCVC